MYCNHEGSDGEFDDDDIKFFRPETTPGDIKALIDRGFLATRGGFQYAFVDWEGELGQSSRAYLEEQRERKRQKQQAYRDRRRRDG